MKKGMMVMAIVAALSFLVSLIAVAPLFAKPASQTTPTSKQQTPAQTPQTQSPQTQKQQFTPPKDQQYSPAKAKFWDLAVDRRCVANGVTLDPVVSLHSGEAGGDYVIPFFNNNKIVGKCFYKVKTPPVNEITEADVKKWGSGNLTYFGQVSVKGALLERRIKVAETLPKFTWEDVQRWKKVAMGNVPKIWNESIDFTFAFESPGDYRWFFFDIWTTIPEYDTGNNKCNTNIQLNRSRFQGPAHKAVSQ